MKNEVFDMSIGINEKQYRRTVNGNEENSAPVNPSRRGFSTLTTEQLKERSRLANAARWDKTIPWVTHGDDTKPLVINGVHIPCYVLSDKTRVLPQTGILNALGMTYGGNYSQVSRIVSFAQSKSLEHFIDIDVISKLSNPFRFRYNGVLAYGYEATILTSICNAVLSARREGKLLHQ
jgi:hypothetical protein